jgi:hypothetical protein
VGISINELRGDPGDATLQNLLGVLSAKLDLCARLPVFAFEAGNAGHESCALAFRRLADSERRSFDELLVCLRSHLEAASASENGALEISSPSADGGRP